MVATQKAVNGFNQAFRIPKRTARLVFINDYEGAEVVVRLDVPVGTFLQINDMVSHEQQLQVFEVFGEKILDSWNLSDDDGNTIEANGNGMNSIPIDLANQILQQWVEVAVQPSLPLDER
jgi:hypothetical protein